MHLRARFQNLPAVQSAASEADEPKGHLPGADNLPLRFLDRGVASCLCCIAMAATHGKLRNRAAQQVHLLETFLMSPSLPNCSVEACLHLNLCCIASILECVILEATGICERLLHCLHVDTGCYSHEKARAATTSQARPAAAA